MQNFIKQVNEVKTFSIDFSPVLATGETISSGNIDIDVIKMSDGSDVTATLLVAGSTTLSGSIILFRITGGTNNEIYKITVNTGNTSGSNKHEEDLVLVVSDDVNLLYTVDELKLSLGITDNNSDSLLFGLVKSSSDYISQAIDRNLFFSSYSETFFLDCPQKSLLLKQYPIVAVDSIVVDGVTLASTSQGYTTWYFTEEGSIDRIDGFNFPSKPLPVVVNYKAGYRVMPEDIRLAVKKLAIGEYSTRKKQGILAETIGNYRIVYNKDSVYTDSSIKEIITRYKRPLV